MKRILALDGGGIKGVFSAAFLASLEEETKEPIGRYFDLIAGTSTGGIIALALGLGYSASNILHLYRALGQRVFARRRRWFEVRSIFRPKYDSAPLRDVLTEHFGQRQLGESSTRLVIPSLSLETGKVHVFKTAHHNRFQKDYREAAVAVALAAAAAPTYFPAYRHGSGLPLVDGGIWANNPVGVAAVEALGVLGWDRHEIRILSIGCSSPLSVEAGRRRPKGFLYWAREIADLFASAQSFSSLGTAQLLAGHDNVFRVAPVMPPGRFALDDATEIPSLEGLGYGEAREWLPRLRHVFLVEPAEPFAPEHSLVQVEAL